MRYCGIDVSARPANQQLVTLHERRGPRAGSSSSPRSTRPAPSSRWRARSRASASARPSSPSTRRRATGSTCSPRARRCARELGLPDGRYERMRVCDALLFRRGLPLYPVPATGQPRRRAGRRGSTSASSCSPRSADLGLLPARRPRARWAGRRRRPALRAAVARPTPTRSSARCSATGRRRSARRGACSSGSPRSSSGRRRPRRRALAPHARRARRVRGRLHRLRARRGPRPLGRATRARASSCCPSAELLDALRQAAAARARSRLRPTPATDLRWERSEKTRATAAPAESRLRPARRAGPRQAARLRHRHHARLRRPVRAQGAAAHGRRRDGRRARPAPRAPAPEPLPRPGQGRRGQVPPRRRTRTSSPPTTS